jgi:uncharacterized protein YcaQ
MTTAQEARRIAIFAQGLSGPRAKTASKNRVIDAVRRLGVLQIDSVNVLARAHYLPLFARLGPYDRGHLDAAAWASHTLFEYWGHMASLVPVELYPLFTWRMERARRGEGTWRHVAEFARKKKKYLDHILEHIRENGPHAASDLETEAKKKSGWWEWSEAKVAVEALFWQGRLAVSSRRGSFERLYDVPERVIPASLLATDVSRADAHRRLLELSARALGIGTEDDLADYFRLARAECRPHLATMSEEGILVPTSVEGWDRKAWIHRDFTRIEYQPAAALVGPFDPMVWHRPRALRMFDFHYRIGIYTPAQQRTHGYYVLPFLLGDSLVARVDLKADRAHSKLIVQSAWCEDGARKGNITQPLIAELEQMANWLQLESIEVKRKGSLANDLRASRR